MNNKRKLYWLITILGIIIILVISPYYFSFPIESNGSNLEVSIRDFYIRGRDIKYEPKIKTNDSVSIGKNKYVVFEINDELGITTLSGNIIGRYKIEYLSYGSRNLRELIIESEGENYILLAGKNINLEVSKIIFDLDGFTYSLDIPKKPMFLVYKTLDRSIEAQYLDWNKLKFYNVEEEDITEKILEELF